MGMEVICEKSHGTLRRMSDRSAAGEDGAETEASVEPPEADCIPRDEGPPRPDGIGNGVPDQVVDDIRKTGVV